MSSTITQGIAGLTMLGCALASTAAGLQLPSNGWVTWEVQATKGAPNWCCSEKNTAGMVATACDLDEDSHQYVSSDDASDSTQMLNVYAQQQDGKTVDLRILSAQCPVTSQSAIAELGAVDQQSSVDWLQQRLDQNRALHQQVVAAIAMHAGDVARDLLIATAKTAEKMKLRKSAIFWMGQVRAADTGDVLKQIMFEDAQGDVRKHAAFSLSQTDLPDRADALIRLGNTDQNRDVRAQAWFWLTQTEAQQSEAAIMAALATEQSHHVREQAIFALSQLPETRAIDALMQVIQDQAMDNNVRKKAVFWLAQHDSEQAIQNLDSLLGAP